MPSIQPIKDKVLPMIDGAAEEYVKANPGWPKRTEFLRQIVVNRGAADLGATARVSQLVLGRVKTLCRRGLGRGGVAMRAAFSGFLTMLGSRPSAAGCQ